MKEEKRKKLIKLYTLILRKLWWYMMFRNVNGLCTMIATLESRKLIKYREEYLLLKADLEYNGPSYSEYGSYWFEIGKIKPRKEWIINRLKQLKNDI